MRPYYVTKALLDKQYHLKFMSGFLLSSVTVGAQLLNKFCDKQF